MEKSKTLWLETTTMSSYKMSWYEYLASKKACNRCEFSDLIYNFAMSMQILLVLIRSTK